MPSDPLSSDQPARPQHARGQATICKERAQLLRDYSDAAKTYSDRVGALSELILSGSEYGVGEARSTCRTAWETTEKSRLALYRHEADHMCDRGAQVSSACDL